MEDIPNEEPKVSNIHIDKKNVKNELLNSITIQL